MTRLTTTVSTSIRNVNTVTEALYPEASSHAIQVPEEIRLWSFARRSSVGTVFIFCWQMDQWLFVHEV